MNSNPQWFIIENNSIWHIDNQVDMNAYRRQMGYDLPPIGVPQGLMALSNLSYNIINEFLKD